ncbi:DNA-directed RNA polymerases IV and V subunit [Sesamum alatum]|uniref:DNA-directed RNA polymerases IV and V subunit n=1 Tax=Sesamum alatum TaxID=300844 RepID=A0AAE1Y5X9_9LAMI|nr:DNA-directed RNA polymerases IV and V subunit [Sesamum alatum]
MAGKGVGGLERAGGVGSASGCRRDSICEGGGKAINGSDKGSGSITASNNIQGYFTLPLLCFMVRFWRHPSHWGKFAYIGANLPTGDIVIGKHAASVVDHSIKLKHTEKGMVHKVVLSANDETGKNIGDADIISHILIFLNAIILSEQKKIK